MHTLTITQQVRDVKDTVGICMSAGGLRSAAFGMGALKALAAAGGISLFSCPAHCVIVQVQESFQSPVHSERNRNFLRTWRAP